MYFTGLLFKSREACMFFIWFMNFWAWFLMFIMNNLLNSVQPSELFLTFWTLTEFISFNVLWSLDPWFDLYFFCVLVNHSRTHKYQELSKSINPLITIDAFNDFLIQSQNHFLHKICSCHVCSYMFLVWTLICGFALTNLLSNLLNNLLNSFWVHTYEIQNVSSGFLPLRQLYFMLNILMFLNILVLVKKVR